MCFKGNSQHFQNQLWHSITSISGHSYLHRHSNYNHKISFHTYHVKHFRQTTNILSNHKHNVLSYVKNISPNTDQVYDRCR